MINWKALSKSELQEMSEAGQQVLNCYRVLGKTGDNIVGEILRGVETFYEMDHYPEGDIYDNESHSQYYYHAHRGPEEHGHFHTFLREAGMAADMTPIEEQSHESYMDEREDKLSHLIAISMDNKGFPTSLFTTNRWVTAENWYSADDVIKMLDSFEIDLVPPSWPVNIWLTSMFILFKPLIIQLLKERDEAIEKWQMAHPDRDVFEDRELEITSEAAISVEDYLSQLDAALNEAA
ncbi:hypothetical protein GUA87_13500 [Sneathiella sp. P13V-1]|uniref:DUF6969 family protein n=1 Tax=Sneathiella sp. P13V-1 TaxID=2697366 RepID=UPI00187B9288|nr:hypothetical protein [Sneathiella sp. P13V-1]MBE7637866.1 hypothetical protein [Sneathiella sp. P13V-1]